MTPVLEPAAPVGTPDLADAQAVTAYITAGGPVKYGPEELDILAAAYTFARDAHAGQTRDSGEPYISHPVEVARILAERGLDADSLMAAVLHDTIEDCGTTYADLVKQFGEPVAKLVEALTKIRVLKDASRGRDKREEQVENQRKMILAMAQDIRVIIIKLADRQHNISTLDALSPERQAKVARETLDVYAPLANRLGMARVRSSLEDACMKYLYPEAFADLTARMKQRAGEREADVERSVTDLKAILAEKGIEAEVTGRAKHIYGIYHKMVEQNLPFEEIHDLVGLRVVCGKPTPATGLSEDKIKAREQADIAACYQVVGVVHGLWTPIHDRFKDYIGHPKDNGYRSIHTTVAGLRGKKLEIQIRTADMHRFNEEGIAAHWKYKEGKRGRQDLDDKLRWLRRLTGWLNDVRDPGEFKEALKNDVFSATIFCFSPKGDVIELPAGSTPVDFAYSIHTNVGDTCIGAKINKKNVSLRHELNNGDFVEVLTHRSGHPSAAWLEFIKTSRARTKIRHWLRQQNQPENIEKGRDALTKALRARGISSSDWCAVEDKLAAVIRSYEQSTPEALLAEIGFGGLDADAVVRKAWPAETGGTAEPPHMAPRKRPAKGAPVPTVVVEGMGETRVNFARCCLPVAGDSIIGLVTSKSRIVNIHQRGCRSLEKSMAAVPGDGQLLAADWGDRTPSRSVRIEVECRDYTGLLAAVSSTITSNNISIVGSSTHTFSRTRAANKPARAKLSFTVKVNHLEQLTELFGHISKMENVTGVKRVCRGKSPEPAPAAALSRAAS